MNTARAEVAAIFGARADHPLAIYDTDLFPQRRALVVGNDAGLGHDGKGQCAFSPLAFAALGGADAPLLAIALAFILAFGFASTPPLRLARIAGLRPPLRGPPARA